MGDLFRMPGLDRLGLDRLVGDHQDTLYRIDDDSKHHPRRADRVVLLGFPLLVGAGAWLAGLHIRSTGGLLNGVAIMSGGLFTLLIAIFGVQTLGASNPRMTPIVARLVTETRANVAYTTACALAVAFVLMGVDAFSAPATPGGKDPGVSAWLTGIILTLVLHLALNLLVVLNRIRLAFSKLG